MSAGYGVDVWCDSALSSGRLARGTRVVAQALLRRTITPRGTLRGGEEESAYGLDVAGYIGAVGYPTAVAALPGLLRAEWLKDDRVADVDVTTAVAYDAAGRIAITMSAVVVLADDGETFDLTLRADDAGVTLLLGAP